MHLNAGMLTPVGGAIGGLTSTQDIIALSDADYRRVMSVNIDGVVFGARAATRVMADRGGALVATASVAGLIPFAGDPIYCLTKHAVIGFVRSLARALQPRGITVNAICPAVVRTAITTEEAFEVVSSVGVPVMEPAQIADAVLDALRSGETGQALVCVPGKPPMRQHFPELDITGRS